MGRWSRKQEIAIILSKYKRKGAHSSAAKFDSSTARALIESGSVPNIIDRHTRSGGQGQGQNWLRKEKRLAIYQRDNHTCAWCKTHVKEGVKLTLDHLTPHSKGGTNSHTNLVTTCLSCNSKRGNRSVVDFAQSISGYLGESASDIIKRVRSTVRKRIDVPAAKILLSRLKKLAENPKLTLEEIADKTELLTGVRFAMKLPGGGLRSAINLRKAQDTEGDIPFERTVYRSQPEEFDAEAATTGFTPRKYQGVTSVFTGTRKAAIAHARMVRSNPKYDVPQSLFKVRIARSTPKSKAFYAGQSVTQHIGVLPVPANKIRKVGTL